MHVQAGVHVPRSRADTPPILRARCSYSQRRYVQVERFCLVKTEVGLCVVAVPSHPRELLSGLMAPPAEGGEHRPRPSSAVSSSSNCCACGNVEGASRIPRTPHLAWAVGSPWPFSPSISSRLAFSCLEEMPVAAVTAPDSSPPSVCLSRDLPKVPCHRRLAESSAPLLSGDMNRSAVSLSLTPATRTPQPLRSAGPQFPSFMKRAISFNRVVLIALNSAVRKQCLSPSAGVKRPVVKPPGAVVPFKQRLPQAQLRRGITGGLSSPLSGG